MMNNKSRRKLFCKQWQLQSMVIPGIAWMLVFCYIPLLYLIIAFMDYNIAVHLFENEWVWLKHFKAFLSDDRFWRSVKNTLGMSALRICIGFPIPILFALLLNEIRSPKFKKAVQTISYLPHFISWAIFGGILLNWLSESGIVNQLMVGLGLQSKPMLYNADPDKFWGIAFVSDTVKEMGWSAIIYLAAISGIDPGLYEAAELDGANRWQKMWHITVQCIRPTIAILFILGVSNCLGSNFDQIFFMKNSANMPKAETIDLYIYNMGLGQGRYSFSTAVLFFRSIIAFGLLQLCNFVSKKLTGESII
ncbi:ABC transporter permease [Lachnotalea sp. AF33-28]|jgi:putative aldouronate transport system permease protein|uniref:ABC transporter permease n=1 Tax=Lachnotalea sp. AF33-28 TaxID=2292046 RepID=UPI000E473365|nr:ABC transporter permease subunit [Lachnotalea sp. AF33-28]RHP35700.1 sugar ABC transporter permease [Lachnotalea sp. AF33-28]